jgi:hypothetical protein
MSNQFEDYPGILPPFPHEDSHIVGISNSYFLNLTEYCTFDLDRIDNEICLAMAKHNRDIFPACAGQLPKKLHTGDFQGKLYEHEYMINHYDDPVTKNTKGLSANERRKYLFFKNKIIQPWGFIFTLKPNTFRDKTQDRLPWEDFVPKELAYTKSCIESLPLKQIGRVVVYASWPNNPVPPHRDGPVVPHQDHHINLNPGGYRPVYLYDSIDHKKHYLDEDVKMYAFNVRDYHGVDSLSRFSYTLRIDGEYQDEILNKFNHGSAVI